MQASFEERSRAMSHSRPAIGYFEEQLAVVADRERMVGAIRGRLPQDDLHGIRIFSKRAAKMTPHEF